MTEMRRRVVPDVQAIAEQAHAADGAQGAPQLIRSVRRTCERDRGLPVMDPEVIVARAKAAFPTDPLPPASDLANDHCDECADVSKAFGARPWTAVALHDIVGKETALLTAAAWRYYLPAVISWCVRSPEALDTLPESTVYQLAPPEAGETDEWFQERKDGFTEAQRDVIVAYLEWYREREQAEYVMLEMTPPLHVYRALEYWRRTQ